MGFIFDGSTNPAFGRREDMDGRVWIWAKATTGATAKYSYMMFVEETGYIATPKADNTEEYRVGVPAKAVASGAFDWFQIGGPVTDLVPTSLSVTAVSVVNTAGYGIYILDGVDTTTGSDYAGMAVNAYAIADETVSDDQVNVILVPDMILAAT
jgi:hypothetical protein